MSSISCTASGSGANGSAIPKTGTVTFKFSTSESLCFGWLYLYPIDSSGEKLSSTSKPGSAGGNWSNDGAPPLDIETGDDTFTVNIATFRNYYSSYTDLAGLKLTADVAFDAGDYAYPYEFDFYFFTACTAPTSCSVSPKYSAGSKVTLSWKGAKAGIGNTITGYDVQRCASSDGSTWGSWETLPESPVAGTSLKVEPPEGTGHYYKYRVRARSSAGTSYYSEWKTSTNTLRKGHDPIPGFSESPLTAGMTVKALHMEELQDRVNTLRGFYGLSAYAFSQIDERGIAGWTDHVNEIKAAIEDICTKSGQTHEAWIEFFVNCPRADVMEQLRAVVLSL